MTLAWRLGMSIATAALVACAPTTEDGSNTGTDEIVIGEIALSNGTPPVASPDGNTVVSVRQAGSPYHVEILRTDLSVTPAKTEVVESLLHPSVYIYPSPTGRYFYVSDRTYHRFRIYSWDLSVRREMRGVDFVVFGPDDRWAVAYSSNEVVVDGKYSLEVTAAAIEIEGPGEANARSRIASGGRIEAVSFAPNGKEVLFRRWDDIFAVDVATATVRPLFTGIGYTDSFVNTYDGDGIVLATDSTNTKWGPDMLVLQKRDGTSTPLSAKSALFGQGRKNSGPEGKNVVRHCIVPQGDALFVFTNAANGVGLAKWSRPAGFAVAREPLAARPLPDGDAACGAAIAADGSFLSFIGKNAADGAVGFATTPPGPGGTERFLPVLNPSARHSLFPDGEVGASGTSDWTSADSGDVHYFDLRSGTPIAKTPADRRSQTTRLENGDLLTVEEMGTAVYRTNANVHTLLLRTTEPINRVLRLGTTRAAAHVKGRLVVFTL